MSEQQGRQHDTAARRRVRVVRRPQRRVEYPDTTVTESWPPRLNKEL